MSGFDKYLEYHFRRSGTFYRTLFEAIQFADMENLGKLAKGFPEEVEAFKTWAYIGRDAFLEMCSDDHPLKKRILSGEYML